MSLKFKFWEAIDNKIDRDYRAKKLESELPLDVFRGMCKVAYCEHVKYKGKLDISNIQSLQSKLRQMEARDFNVSKYWYELKKLKCKFKGLK